MGNFDCTILGEGKCTVFRKVKCTSLPEDTNAGAGRGTEAEGLERVFLSVPVGFLSVCPAMRILPLIGNMS